MSRAWLFKSEPDVYGYEHLAKETTGVGRWDGVRNYQARNMLRDDVAVGDTVLFYHSRVAVPGIVGVAHVVRAAYPDPLATDPRSNYFDPKSSLENPRWFSVDIKAAYPFKHTVSLDALKRHPILRNMRVAQTGNRLSVNPVSDQELAIILELAMAS